MVKYLANVAAESDFEFAFKIEDDYANIYEVGIEGRREGEPGRGYSFLLTTFSSLAFFPCYRRSGC